MSPALIPPASFSIIGIPTLSFSILITVIGLTAFAFIGIKRLIPLFHANPDRRLENIGGHIWNILTIWLGQYRQPRYLAAGTIHIAIFFGFLVLLIRTLSLAIMGFLPGFAFPGFDGALGQVYNIIKDYAATVVLIACVVAAVRRGMFAAERYQVPPKYGKNHTGEAIFVLGVISLLMITESLYEASLVVAEMQKGMHVAYLAPVTLAWCFKGLLSGTALPVLQGIHLIAFFLHDISFFFFLCFLPFGKHFHVLTSIVNVFFMRVRRGDVKPVKFGIAEDKLDELESFGVKKLEDFTWKQLLDFYSCADCGRCSEHCPANAAGRPLSPRFISIKGRDLIFRNYPLFGKRLDSKPLIGDIYEEEEIWSCTTCGACEQECPLGIEYIDKIVDLRRGMVDEGMVPQSLQKPLKALEKRGNPWGKMEKKRLEWAKDEEFAKECQVKSLEKGESAETLYYVDSISSFDERMQDIARSTARILTAANIDFGVLGKLERDAGNEVKRFGEEMLYQDLKDNNTAAILESGVKTIVTADPHAYNVLKNEYSGLPPVEHISQVIAQNITSGKIKLDNVADSSKVYTYHDPCYLGRHNSLYQEPRNIIDAIPGLKRVEMKKCRDRSFCCGGGGLMLFYEPEEETRMGVLRVKMADEVGASVIVTACPFCLVNMEDAIKVAGMEGRMEAIDLSELVDRHLKK